MNDPLICTNCANAEHGSCWGEIWTRPEGVPEGFECSCDYYIHGGNAVSWHMIREHGSDGLINSGNNTEEETEVWHQEDHEEDGDPYFPHARVGIHIYHVPQTCYFCLTPIVPNTGDRVLWVHQATRSSECKRPVTYATPRT